MQPDLETLNRENEKLRAELLTTVIEATAQMRESQATQVTIEDHQRVIIAGLQEALRKSAAVFHRYAVSHNEKGATAKAEQNFAHAYDCEAAIDASKAMVPR